MKTKTVLVTGSTGYVGSRLIPRLLQAGYRVRATARSIEKLRSRPWAGHPNLELAAADALDLESLKQAARGCGAAYYLVHSMNPLQEDFAEADRQAALNMVFAAEETGMERIIYLGGLGRSTLESPRLSKHLHSRAEVGSILKSGTVPVTILRAAMILGSGSASFEILRYLVERLPVMTTPSWVRTPCQPIAIRNVLGYLIGCLEHPETSGQTYDIGGYEVLTYRKLMQLYAEEAGLGRRLIIPVPMLTPRLSSLWIHLVTPVPASLARPLAEGLRNPVICHDNRIRTVFPQELLDCRTAIRLALERTRTDEVESSWSDAGWMPPAEWSDAGDPEWSGGTVYGDWRRIVLKATPEEVWRPIARIGGKTGWYYANWLWNLRGLMDHLVGGVGIRRGRRHATELHAGDALDFWRVIRVEPGKHLLLLAEMKLPGKAILEFRIRPIDARTTVLIQSARFLPRGLFGILYWYLVSPLHYYIFRGMLRNLGRAVLERKNNPPFPYL